jgi:hypothetical protein
MFSKHTFGPVPIPLVSRVQVATAESRRDCPAADETVPGAQNAIRRQAEAARAARAVVERAVITRFGRW